MYKLQKDITPQFARESICQMPWKEMPRNSGIKTGRWSVRLLSGSQHHGPNLHSEAIFEKSLEYGKDLFACFVDLEKAYDRVSRDKLWKVLQEYGVNGQLLRAIKSFYSRSKVCVRVNGKQSKPFHVGVGLRQGCVLSPLLFIVYVNWIDKCSQADECATIGNCKVSRLLFADDLVLLSSTESGLQCTLKSFADQRWSPRGRPWPWGRPRGHILKSLASKVKSLASRAQVLENWPVLGSRTALIFGLLKFCGALKNILENVFLWRLPEKFLWRPFFFLESTCACVLGLEHSCPWPREVLSSERLSLASDFFCVLGLGLEPWVLDSTSVADTCNTAGMKISTAKTEVLHLSRNPDQWYYKWMERHCSR